MIAPASISEYFALKSSSPPPTSNRSRPATPILLELVDTVVAVELEVVPLSVGLAGVGGQRAARVPADRPAGVNAALVRRVAADSGGEVHIPFFTGFARGHDQRTGDRVSTVQRALRTLHDLDLRDAGQFLVERIRIGLQHAVDHQCKVGLGIPSRVDPADRDLHVARLGGLNLRNTGGQRDEVLRSLDARALDVALRERRDRRGHILDALFALSCRDDDLLESAARLCFQHAGHR